MEKTKDNMFLKGLRDGIPIALGYFAVAFALGITAKNAGLSASEATAASFLCTASAGEYACFKVIASGGSYLEVILISLVANIRYLLMSCALSQKFSKDTPFFHRILVGFNVTDEIFGIAISQKGFLSPAYWYGAVVISVFGWCLGTFFGVVIGNVLPVAIVNALSVGLFGMFIAIIIPPARENKLLIGIIAVSMGLSFLFDSLPVLADNISSGTATIILTVLISGVSALLFPVKEDEDVA